MDKTSIGGGVTSSTGGGLTQSYPSSFHTSTGGRAGTSIGGGLMQNYSSHIRNSNGVRNPVQSARNISGLQQTIVFNPSEIKGRSNAKILLNFANDVNALLLSNQDCEVSVWINKNPNHCSEICYHFEHPESLKIEMISLIYWIMFPYLSKEPEIIII